MKLFPIYRKAYHILCPYNKTQLFYQLEKLDKEKHKFHDELDTQYKQTGDNSFEIKQTIVYTRNKIYYAYYLTAYGKIISEQADSTELEISYRYRRNPKWFFMAVYLCLAIVILSAKATSITKMEFDLPLPLIIILAVLSLMIVGTYFYDRSYIHHLHTDITKALRKKH